MQFRFDDDELTLIRAAEQVRGAAFAREGTPAALRDALALARLGKRLRALRAGELLVLSSADLRLLADAVHFAADEVRWLADLLERGGEPDSVRRRQVAQQRRVQLSEVFPDLVERGGWRCFGS